jgi:restriction endonuclease S subunit
MEFHSHTENHISYQTYKLSDLCHFEKGMKLHHSQRIEGDYLVIDNQTCPKYSHSFYNTERDTLICSIIGLTAGNIRVYPVPTYVTDNCVKITIKNTQIVLKEYLHRVMLYKMKDKIKNIVEGSAIKIIKMRNLMDLEIKIPPLQYQNFQNKRNLLLFLELQ